jgi:P-type Ca2+ transporter type 2C
VKASTLSLSVLVVIEMLNALNALSEDNSLLVIHPFVNPWLLVAIVASIGSHMFILYVPLMNQVFGITPLNVEEWKLVIAFSVPVILIDEVLKFFGRIMNDRELKARMALLESEKK